MDLIKLIDQNVECVATKNGKYLKRSEVFEVVEKFTSTNKPIMPLPTLEEVQESFAYNPDGIKKHVTGDEYSAIQFTYDYLTRQQHNV